MTAKGGFRWRIGSACNRPAGLLRGLVERGRELGGRARRICGKVAGEEGGSLVEFAVSCTVLFVFMFGSITMCLGLYTRNTVSEYAREATRYAVVRGSTSTDPVTASGITTYVQGLGILNNNTSYLGVTTVYSAGPGISCSGTCTNTPGNYVAVTVSYQFPWHVPFTSGQTIAMSSTSKMVIIQ